MKFRNAARKVKSIVSLSLKSRCRPQRTYNNNPLLMQYYYLIFYWIILNISVFFWHSYQHNPLKGEEKSLGLFVCQKDERKMTLTEGKKNCVPYTLNIYTQVFYGLNIVYLLFAIAQIKAGKKVCSTHILDLGNPVVKLKYTIKKQIPLLRETMMILEYCAKKTCLHFSDFILVFDIIEYMHIAKIKHLVDLDSPTGKGVSRVLRMGIMIGVGLGLILALVTPLYLFSEGMTRETYDITKGSIELQLLDKHEQKIGTLFDTDKMIENRNLTDLPNSGQTFEKIYQEKSLKRYYKNAFKMVRFRKYSDSYLQMTPKLLEELKSYIIQQGNVKMRFILALHVRIIFLLKT